jgi:hypothetical protein
MPKLTLDLGDTKTFRVPLRLDGRPFDASGSWGLTFTVKSDPLTETDAEALFQKSLGAGITLDGTAVALVSIIRADTYREEDELEEGSPAFQADPGTYYWDIHATGTDENEGRFHKVAQDVLVLTRDVTRGAASSVTIHTTEPPFLGVGDIIDGGEPDTDYEDNFEIDGGEP